MERLKFRGKSILNGVWLYGDLVHSADGTRTGILVNDASTYDECEVYPDTVGISTGLHDISGAEIFSDDVISLCLYCGKARTPQGLVPDLRKRGIGIVFYDTELARWRVKHRLSVSNLINRKEAKSIRFKILGNIHDNPDYKEQYSNQ